MNARTYQNGNTIILVMVGIILTSLFAYYFISYMSTQSRTENHNKIREDLIDVRRFVEGTFSCTQTLGSPAVRPAACTAAVKFVNLYRENGSVLIAIPAGSPVVYTTVGKLYYLRASCIGCTGGLCPPSGYVFSIEVSRRYSSTAVAKDPLNKKSLDWQDVLSGVPVPCVIP